MNKDFKLTIAGWHVFRGERHVLKGLRFEVPAGTCVQVLGDNGAGKTTLLRSIAGLVPREEGELFWRGCAVREWAPFHAELGYLGHDPPLKSDLTGRENQRFAVAVRRDATCAELDAAIERVGATKFADRPVRTLSAGQRRRIAFATLLAFRAPLWLLDEPTTHLDAVGCALLRSLLEEHLDAGGIALAATHQELGLAPQRMQRLNLAGVG